MMTRKDQANRRSVQARRLVAALMVAAGAAAFTGVGPVDAAPASSAKTVTAARRYLRAKRVAPAPAATPSVAAAPADGQGRFDSATFEGMVNNWRTANGLPQLAPNGSVRDAAYGWSIDMSQNGFRHNLTLGPGSAENIYYVQGRWSSCSAARADLYNVSDMAFQAFKNSPGHNANMLTSWVHYEGAGIYCLDGATGSRIWVTHRFYY